LSVKIAVLLSKVLCPQNPAQSPVGRLFIYTEQGSQCSLKNTGFKNSYNLRGCNM